MLGSAQGRSWAGWLRTTPTSRYPPTNLGHLGAGAPPPEGQQPPRTEPTPRRRAACVRARPYKAPRTRTSLPPRPLVGGSPLGIPFFAPAPMRHAHHARRLHRNGGRPPWGRARPNKGRFDGRTESLNYLGDTQGEITQSQRPPSTPAPSTRPIVELFVMRDTGHRIDQRQPEQVFVQLVKPPKPEIGT